MTGYQSKKAAARDKLEDDDTQVYKDHGDALTIAYQSGYYDGKKAAQPAQEPVAWMYQCTVDNSEPVLLRKKQNWAESGTGLWVETPLSTTPPQRTEQCNYPDCKCPTENPCLKKLAQPAQEPWPEEPFGHMAGGVQPAQEPVAWQAEVLIQGVWSPMGNPQRGKSRAERLAANPSIPKEYQRVIELYNTPPQRPWVDLTDEEIKCIEETTTCSGNESWLRNLTRNLEAKLKEKNNAA